MGKIMRNDVEYGGGFSGGGDVSQLEQRVERLEDDVDSLERYKVTQLTFNTGIDIGDWDSVIDPDEPVIYEKYVNYHDAVAKLSQQIDVMGNRTDDLKTSLNTLASGNVTINSTYVSAIERSGWFKRNGVVYIDLTFNTKDVDIPSTSTLLTGLPAPLTGFRVIGMNCNTVKPLRFYINTSGALMNAYNQNADIKNTVIQVTISYLAKDI